MVDAAYYSSRHAPRRRYWPVEHLTEILAVLIILLITIRVPGISQLTTLGWLGLAGLLFVVRRVELSVVLVRWWPLLLVPALAAASYFWSTAPDVSLKYGLQLFATALVGIMIARTLSPSQFLTALFFATLIFCVLSVASNRQGLAAEGAVLIGLVGSKNQMSAMGFLLLFSAFATFLNASAPRLARLASLPGMAIGGYVVATTASATAVLVSVGSIGAFAALLMLQPMKPAGRVGLVLALALIASPIALLLPEIERAVNDFIINVLRKDPGLTGRDYLWARADELIAMRPILGHGFQAAWLGDSPETQGLLRWAGVTDGRTFNFHNTYRQFAVDTGLVGLAVLLATLIATVCAGLRQLVMRPHLATTFCFVLLAGNLARMYTEMLLVAFSVHTALIFTCIVYAFWRPQPGWDGQPLCAPSAPPPQAAYEPPPMTPHYLLAKNSLSAPKPRPGPFEQDPSPES